MPRNFVNPAPTTANNDQFTWIWRKWLAEVSAYLTSGRMEPIDGTTKTATFTITDAYKNTANIVCDTTGGAFTVYLNASPTQGRVYTVILEAHTGTLTINGNGNNINGAATTTLTAVGAVTLIFNGTQWNIKS